MDSFAGQAIRFTDRARENYVYPRVDVVEDRLTDVARFTQFLSHRPSQDRGIVLYIHLPFCDTLCGFCPYFKLRTNAVDQSTHDRFYNALAREIAMYGKTPFLAGRPVSVIQFGGGTPMVTEVRHWEQIFAALRESFDTSRVESITAEATVESIDDLGKLKRLRELGINRVSFGVQTFNPLLRRKLGLKGRVQDILRAVELLRAAGIEHYAADLMYNLPDQEVSGLEDDLEQMLKLDPRSVDVYPLTVYANTQFEHVVENKRVFTLKPELARELMMYDLLRDRFAAAGYFQVKSFTFSKDTPAWLGSRLYLRNGHVVGIGPSSKSFLSGYNYRNVPSLEGYIDAIEAGSWAIDCGNYADELAQSERMMVFAPVMLGVPKNEVEHYERFKPIVDTLIRSGYVEDTGDEVRLTREGGKWTGNISRLFYSRDQAGKSARSYLFNLENRKHPYNQDDNGIRSLNR
jgi:oxygen-independent coproporphyrinogen III oxidase